LPAGILAAVEQNRIELDRSDTGVVVVVLTGEHDVYTAPTLRDRISAVFAERVPIVIDLTPATFIDSSVLRVLLEARRRAEEEGVGFSVALGDGEAPGVRRVLEITGLVSVFPVLPAREAALEVARSAEASS
jgi:anti-sigma B factor antagonist